jgi:hypothetical protein
MGKKVEIIEVNIGIDIDEEIKKGIDSLKSDIVIHTKDLIKKSSLIKIKSNRKKKKIKERNSKIEKAIKYLEHINEHCGTDSDESWVTGHKLLEIAGIEISAQNLNKFSLQARKFLEKADKWVLLKKRKSRKTVYRLGRFS